MTRLELGDGQWADLRERLTYGQAREVRRVSLSGDRSAMADLDLAFVVAYTQAWNVLDFEGHAVPIDEPESAPDEVIQAIAAVALARWDEASRPLVGRTNGRSRSTRRVSA